MNTPYLLQNWKSKIGIAIYPYFHTLLQACYFLLLLLSPIITCQAQTITTTTDLPIVFQNLDELTTTKAIAKAALVTDKKRGGYFIYTKDKLQPDNGVVFKSAIGGFWVRSYNQVSGVDIAWFGAKLDTVSNDMDALKNALKYDFINITGLLKLDGKINLPERKTISFTTKGGFFLADSCLVNFGSYLFTEDYSYIFRGNGKIVFGQKATKYVSPCWFGAIADYRGANTSTDNKPAIQKSIVAAEDVSDVYLPPSPAGYFYRIGSRINIEKKLHFYSFTFRGGGTTITNSQSVKATTIFADFTDEAAINIQGCRRSYISDFRLIGKNSAPKTVLMGRWKNPIYGSASYDTVTYFYDKGVSEKYVGIATDAIKEDKTLSADIQFNRLQIEGFMVGISINDAGNLQGDRMRVNNTQINYCTYGISIGNPQARACNFTNVDMNYVYTGYTNSLFGSKTGSEFEINGGQYCNLYKLFHIQPYNLGQCLVSGLYAEAVGNIGEIGYGTSNDNSFVFTGCNINLMDITGLKPSYGFYSKYYTLHAFANVSFIGCNFTTYKPYIAFCAGNKDLTIHPLINFNGCTFYRSKFFHAWGNVNIENSHFAPKEEPLDLNRTIRANMDGNGNRRYNTGFDAALMIPLLDGISLDSVNKTYGAKLISRTIPKFYSVQTGGNDITKKIITSDTIDFTYSQRLEDSLFSYVLPNDILGTTLKGLPTDWDNPTLSIIDINHQSRLAKAIMFANNITFDKIALYTNCFFTTIPILGTIATGSNKITNTQNENLLKVGDFIKFKNALKPYRINAIDNTNHEITLIGNITETSAIGIEVFNLQIKNGE